MDLSDISVLRRAQHQLHLAQSAKGRTRFGLQAARLARVARLEGEDSALAVSEEEGEVADGSEDSITILREVAEESAQVLDTVIKEHE